MLSASLVPIIMIIILSRGVIHLSGWGKLRTRLGSSCDNRCETLCEMMKSSCDVTASVVMATFSSNEVIAYESFDCNYFFLPLLLVEKTVAYV